ncbi:spermidine synthase [Legionella saoudiensis]|uniref:spermidine synthase n=1 Tax=Legionella saoudiensis TaxID=1750561 RepID=UPI0007319AE6|nr:hypothetical protein [Legionella saoudiensis]
MWKTKFGKCIYESPSGYKVYQNFFYRWLTLGSTALQTVINRRHPQRPVLHYLPALTLMARQYPGASCLLGLGGAGIPLMLSREQPPLPSLTVIDKSEEVIDIAKRFFISEELKNLTIIHDDAMNYVAQTNETYTHLMIDLYNAHFYPPECNNELFFSSCQRIIADGGFLALNLANIREQWPLFQLVKKYFKHTLVIPIKKSANMVIIASNDKNKEHFFQQVRMSGELKQIIWVESWDYVGDL